MTLSETAYEAEASLFELSSAIVSAYQQKKTLKDQMKMFALILICRSYPKARYVGYHKVNEPALLLRDLDLIKDVLVTKFNAFNKNDFAIDPKVSQN